MSVEPDQISRSERRRNVLPGTHAGFRGDLEGIRGIALVVILTTHLINWPTGGFVALDMFFILSGFLITGLLVREFNRTSTMSLVGFIGRRIRRLAPAATLVLIIGAGLAFVIFGTARAMSVLWDGIWAMLLVSNWNFIVHGTDYFAHWTPQSPFLHFWSLSVEEQFYLVWPILILSTLLLGTHFLQRPRRFGTKLRHEFGGDFVAVIAVTAITLASLGWSIYESQISPDSAYLST